MLSQFNPYAEGINGVLCDHANHIQKLNSEIIRTQSVNEFDEWCMDLIDDLKGYVGSEAVNANTLAVGDEYVLDLADEWVSNNYSSADIPTILGAAFWLYGIEHTKSRIVSICQS